MPKTAKQRGKVSDWIGRRVWAPSSMGLALGTVAFARNASIDGKPYIRLHVALDNGYISYCHAGEVIRDFDSSPATRKNPYPQGSRRPPNQTEET